MSQLCLRAWREGFTITLVSGRTVGIGAYLARLGRRCVQRADQPIILTGFQALNKVLGKEVRSSLDMTSQSLVRAPGFNAGPHPSKGMEFSPVWQTRYLQQAVTCVEQALC